MNILHVTPTAFGEHGVFGGGERYVENVVHAVQTARGEMVTQAVAAMGKGPSVTIDKQGWKLHVLRSDSLPSNRLDYFSRELWSIAERFDLIHVHQPFTNCGRVALVMAAQLGKAIVATDLGGGFLVGSACDHPVSLAHRIIAISRFAARFVASLTNPIDVIIGPVDGRFFQSPLDQIARRGVLYVGRLTPHKGVDRILSQAPANLPIKIVGSIADQMYFDHLKGLAKTKDVEFHLDVSDEALAKHYSQAAACIVPSVVKDYRGGIHLNSELMGITTMEALASGTAVAVARTTSLPELVTDDTVGRIFADDQELRTVLEDVAAGHWPKAGQEGAARAYAKVNFGAEVVGAAILETYRRAANKTPLTC